ncbi:hypothetical protein BKA81DRAFT_111970 [Phyllosticta paracitricarpa]|uniref:Secreted protein n=2 Tax=Phyllosticta TaxID=121621 RepID=A0ABR1LIV2_9PEZI
MGRRRMRGTRNPPALLTCCWLHDAACSWSTCAAPLTTIKDTPSTPSLPSSTWHQHSSSSGWKRLFPCVRYLALPDRYGTEGFVVSVSTHHLLNVLLQGRQVQQASNFLPFPAHFEVTMTTQYIHTSPPNNNAFQHEMVMTSRMHAQAKHQIQTPSQRSAKHNPPYFSNQTT